SGNDIQKIILLTCPDACLAEDKWEKIDLLEIDEPDYFTDIRFNFTGNELFIYYRFSENERSLNALTCNSDCYETGNWESLNLYTSAESHIEITGAAYFSPDLKIFTFYQGDNGDYPYSAMYCEDNCQQEEN